MGRAASRGSERGVSAEALPIWRAARRRIQVPCECAGTCSYFVIETWLDGDDDWFGEFYVELHSKPRWRDHFKAAWEMLRGRTYVAQSQAWSTETAKRLRDELDALIAEKERAVA